MDTKSPLRSKTLIFNGLALLVFLAAAVMSAIYDGTGTIDPANLHLPQYWERYAAMIVVAGNVVLRFVTKQGLSFNRNDENPPPPAEAVVDAKSLPRVYRGAALLAPFLLCAGDVGAQTPTPVPTRAVKADENYKGPPIASISGPSGGVPGDEIVLDFSGSKGDIFDIQITRRGYSAAETHYQLADDRRSAEIRGYPGVYDCELIVGNSHCPEVGVARKLWTVTIWATYPVPPVPPTPAPQPNPVPPTPPQPEPTPAPTPEPAPTPQPEPAPTPTPTPDPEPNIPEGRFGVARKVYDQAIQVSSGHRHEEAQAIVRVLQDMHDALKDPSSDVGKIRGNKSQLQDKIRTDLLDGMNAALSVEAQDSWRGGFGLFLAQLIFDLLTSGKLSSWQDWVDLLLEIISALNFV